MARRRSAIDEARAALRAKHPDAPRELIEYVEARGLYVLALRFYREALARLTATTDALAIAHRHGRREQLVVALAAEDARLHFGRAARLLALAIGLSEERGARLRIMRHKAELAAERRGEPVCHYVPKEKTNER